MSGNENKIDPTSDAPLTDEEFDAWWPFSDDDLDEYERGIVEAFRDHELVFPPHLDEERQASAGCGSGANWPKNTRMGSPEPKPPTPERRANPTPPRPPPMMTPR